VIKINSSPKWRMSLTTWFLSIAPVLLIVQDGRRNTVIYREYTAAAFFWCPLSSPRHHDDVPMRKKTVVGGIFDSPLFFDPQIQQPPMNDLGRCRRALTFCYSCPAWKHSPARIIRNHHHVYKDWCRTLQCPDCSAIWFVCTQCNLRSHMKDNKALTTHNRLNHIGNKKDNRPPTRRKSKKQQQDPPTSTTEEVEPSFNHRWRVNVIQQFWHCVFASF
jgi:hypothetical protein